MSAPGLPDEDGTPILPGDASRLLDLHPSQTSPGQGAHSTTFFRTLFTLPLVDSGQSSPREGAGSTAEDELAGSKSGPAVHRLGEGRFEKD